MKSIYVFFRNRINLFIGGAIVLGFVLMAIFAPVIAPYHPVDDANLMVSEQPPDAEF